ncbi:MAG TPA: ABC transporter ATP-binding protein [Sandaracinaceae bacterium LLY-WYZ-13_1]|nr:ABC transporter ATP-binding protein [Sandaracinaceae bacterium LLY-WYZ-13_1]
MNDATSHPARPSAAPAQLAPPEEEVRHDLNADLSLLRRLVPYAKPHKLLFGTALVMMPLASGAALFRPLLIKEAIDAALVEQSREGLMETVWFFMAAIVVEFLARFAQIYTMQLGGQRALAQLRRDTFAKIQRLHISYFDRTPVGKVVTRVTNDVDSLGEVFASGAVMAVADVLMLVGIVGFMLYLDWRLSLVAFCALPPLALVVNLFRRFAREAFRAIRTKIALLNAYLAEQVQGVAVIQAFGREAECAKEYEQINAEYRDANHRSIRFDALLYSVVEAVSAITVALVLWYAATRLAGLPEASTAAWVGTVVAFYEYIQRFFVPIRDLSQKYTIVQSSLAAAERIFGVLDRTDHDAPDDVEVPPPPALDEDAVMAFRGVRFGYREDVEVLHGVDFEARRGEKIAIVGATGAGKTTVTSLLLRLYDVWEGHVMVQGRDVRTYDKCDLRRTFGVVAQDVFLFAGTILENVAVGEPDPDRARARTALRKVGAWDLVERRPGGLDGRVDERGANFSAGERQLLAFARALYLDREILILDEATASIDSETEARLQRAVDEVLADRTAIVIAHRLSTIRKADRILVFHKGRIVEEGSHEALLRRNGIYARLHRLQFAEA